MTYLLDTHVLVRWCLADRRLARVHQRLIRRATEERPLWISDISLWEVPASFPRDPADRIIVATARVLAATLLTSDDRIVESELVPTLS